MNLEIKVTRFLLVALFIVSSPAYGMHLFEYPSFNRPPIDDEVKSQILERTVALRMQVKIVHLDSGAYRANLRSGLGVLISDQWIVTCGHIMKGATAEYTHAMISGQSVPVSQILIHPKYSSKGPFDIALVRLKNPTSIRVSKSLRPFESPTSPMFVVGHSKDLRTECFDLDHWFFEQDVVRLCGTVTRVFDRLDQLDSIQKSMLDHAECSVFRELIHSRCGSELDSRLAAADFHIQPGDSGGGLFQSDGSLVGVTVSSLGSAELEFTGYHLWETITETGELTKLGYASPLGWAPLTPEVIDWIESKVSEASSTKE